MAFDGITMACLVDELNRKIKGGRISKIAQPEKDEIILTIKGEANYRLFISANASLPLIYLTDDNKQSPLTAPAFCMLLRKHFNSARILDIKQGKRGEPSLERTVDFTVEHLDEMGDLKEKHLIVEIMGKHSNIILCDESYKILDSIKRVNSFMSSVREVLPGREYFLPQTVEKADPLTLSPEQFEAAVLKRPEALSKAIYSGLTGLSPQAAEEICHRAGVDAGVPARELSEDLGIHLYKTLDYMMEDVKNAQFAPHIVEKDGEAVEFAALPLTIYTDEGYTIRKAESPSEMLAGFYSKKNAQTVIRQKSADLRKIVNTAIEREAKKLSLQQKQLEDTEKRDKYKVYGELITAYGYSVENGAKQMQCLNYYTNEEITIPLNPEISPLENAKKYFERYAKLKRTYEALSKFIVETEEALEHLNSVSLALEIATDENDLNQIKEELIQSGYIRFHAKTGKDKQKKAKSSILHYVSPDNVHFYVGKNNTQNDELTFKIAANNDWWFHAKGCPGSHVIMVTDREEMPDSAFEDAGALAVYYSSVSKTGKAEVDYVKRKEVKKPANAKPGFVVYYTNYSLVAKADISRLTLIP